MRRLTTPPFKPGIVTDVIVHTDTPDRIVIAHTAMCRDIDIEHTTDHAIVHTAMRRDTDTAEFILDINQSELALQY